HGSAPDIAGQGIGNPVALMNSAAMLLEWLGARHDRDDLIKAAKRFDDAIDRVLENPANHTPDLGGSAKTADVGDAVAAEISK
ncbi:MAG: isocitrate/isopropylmalate dehydrogenase family protein, partial [Alphaproteobacteria bacterium]|nr:isocitrate/isopropylmalate dehydrogenase family protein [Alphaproteobacteria bacterium]